HTFGDDVTRLRMDTGTAYSCQQVQQLLALAQPCLHQCLDALPLGHRRLRCGDHGKILPKKFCFYLLNEKTLEAGAGGDNWPQAPAMPFFGTKCICVGKTTAWHKTVFL